MAVGILVATVVIAIERHRLESRVAVDFALPELVRAVVGIAVVSVRDRVSPVDGPHKPVTPKIVPKPAAVIEQRLSIGDGVVVARRGARRLDSEGRGAKTVRGEVVMASRSAVQPVAQYYAPALGSRDASLLLGVYYI